MTKEQAMEHFGYGDRLNYKQLVANIIVAATALHWDEARYVREFWYNPIKAIILRLFPEVNQAHGNEKKYKQFDAALSALTEEHIITYRSLGLVDSRTLRELYEALDQANCWSNIILFVEKDSAYIHLRPLSDLLNITMLSGGGWSKTGAAEALIAKLDKDKEYEVYGVSDHDPHGFGIGEEASEKLKTLGLRINKYQRIGISPEQMSEEIRDSQKYPVKMTLNIAPQWCEEHGLEGPYQTVYKTVTQDGVKRKVLVYEGTKCYGLEIEAVSGQPGGPRLLREIILQELLEHLEEYDRIWELTEPIWNVMPRIVLHHYLDAETYEYWQENPVVDELTNYISPDDYHQNRETIADLKEEAVGPLRTDLYEAENELLTGERHRDENVAEKYTDYQTEIQRLFEEHIRPLEDRRDEEIEVIRERDNIVVVSWRNVVDSIEGQIWDVEAPFDKRESELETNYQKSRSLYAEAIFQWLKNNIQRYIDLAPETEFLSFGMMKGCLLEALKDGESVRDLIHKVANWDETQAFNYIGNDIDGDMGIQEEIWDILERLCGEAFG